jgi:hypothetical protein
VLKTVANVAGKDEMIKAILHLIKADHLYGGLGDVKKMITTLKNAGFDWPEFAVIEKSLNAEST